MISMLRNLHGHSHGHSHGGNSATPLLVGLKLGALWIIWILGFVFGILPYYMYKLTINILI